MTSIAVHGWPDHSKSLGSGPACLSYSSQSWYQDTPLYPLSLCQVSRQSDMVFTFYSSFCKCAKRERKIITRKKMKKLSQFLKLHISGTPEAILLKFCVWSTEVEGRVHSKNRFVSSKQHRATEVLNCIFVLPVNILTV